MNKGKVISLWMIVLITLVAVTQVSAQTITTVPQKYPGIYIADESSLSHDPYDPATNYETLGGSIIQEIYEGLYTYNGNNATTYRPLLATNYTISPNGLNYTFTIRKNVTFTDGSPLNAYVFQYSIQRAIIMNDPSSGIWILDQSIRNASWIGGMYNENITQANTFLGNMSVHANSEYSLSIYINNASASFIPELIFNAADAVSPSWIITHEPTSYNTNQSDANIYGMVSLNNMFPQLNNASIRKYLGLTDTSAFPSLANSGIVPQSAHDDPQVGYTYFTDHAMGTGPYKLSSETAGVSITLKRNDNWWNKANFHKAPNGKIDAPQQVIMKVVPETTRRISDIKNNEADTAYIPVANLGEIMNTNHVPYINNINIYTYPSLITDVLAFNENNTISVPGQLKQTNSLKGYNEQYIKNNNIVKYSWKDANGSTQYASPGNPFSALLFRKAFAYAWNYNGYMNDVLGGNYNRLSGVIPSGLFGHQSDLISAGYIPSQNLVLAKHLFKQVNWQGSIRMNYYSGNYEMQNASQLLANVINNLGVGITIKLLEVQWGCHTLNCYTPGDAPMFFLGWSPDYADASDYTVPFLHTGGLFPTSMHYSNPHVDALMDKADAMSTNNATRNQLYRQMEINASGDYPYIYLYQANSITVVNRWVTDWNSAYAGNENPMSYGTQYQFVGLEAYTPNPSTTTPPKSSSTNGIFLLNLFSGGLTFILIGLVVVIPSTIAIIVFRYPNSAKKIKNITKIKEKVKERTKKPAPISEETFNQLEKIIQENKK